MEHTVVVTGAGRGIGLELCRQLRAKGHRVIGTLRDESKGDALRELGAACEALDVTSEASIRGFGDRMKGTPVDVLINNAGVSGKAKALAELTRDELADVFGVNTFAPLLVARALRPAMDQGRRKLIVHITSQLGSLANNTGGSTYAYRASKAALNQLNRSLAVELAPAGYACVAIHPGWVRTDMGGPSAPLSVEQSASSMLAVIERAGAGESGRFLNYDGQPLPW